MKDTAAGNYHPNEADGTCGQYLGTERLNSASILGILGVDIRGPEIPGFIVGGEYTNQDTKRGELPYQAALGYKAIGGSIKYNCGGTLINRYIFSIQI